MPSVVRLPLLCGGARLRVPIAGYILSLFSLILAVAGPVHAQGVRGVAGRQAPMRSDGRPYVEGRVVAGSENSGIHVAEVRLYHQTGSELARTSTNSQGEFSFYGLSEGTYELSVTHPDFQPKRATLLLQMGPALGVRIALEPKQTGPMGGPVGVPAASTVPVWALHIPAEAEKEYKRGIEHLEAGRPKKSLKHLQAAARLYSEYAGAYSAMGTVSLKLGRQDQAMAAYQKALEIDSNLAEAAFGLGALLAAQQRYDEAERYLLRARRLSPRNWRVHLELGELYRRQGEWEASEASLQRAYNLHQDYPRLHLLLINVLALQEKYPQTLAAMNTFLTLFPEDDFAPQVSEKRDRLQAMLETLPAARPSDEDKP